MKSNKKIFLIIIIIIVLSFLFFRIFREPLPKFNFIKVVTGEIKEEISESGVIKKGEEISLGFESGGRISKIYVKSGDKVEKGNYLAELDSKDLNLQLEKAKNQLVLSELNLERVSRGASKQEIETLEIKVESLKQDFNSTKENLENTKSLSNQKKENAYRDVLPAINESSVKVSTTLDEIKRIFQEYFSRISTEETRKASDARDGIEASLNEIKISKNLIDNDYSYENIDNIVFKIEDNLKSTINNINIFLEVLEDSTYRPNISDSDIASVNSQKTIINQMLSSVSSVIKSIELAKSSGNLEVSSAKSQLVLAEGNLNQALKELSRVKTLSEEDVRIYQIQVEQAKKEIEIINNLINDSLLKAPSGGEVLSVNFKENEIISPGQTILSFVSDSGCQVEANIYEGDISKVKAGNQVEVKIVAFPDQIFNGEVIYIEPSSKVIDGVVYYKVIIDVKDLPSVLPGMTADIVIRTQKKENVLIVPKVAVKKIDNRTIVDVFRDGKIEEREIEVGLKGNDFFEVISGVQEGEEILIGKK